ncbi:MAG: hypothetical protein GWP08_11355 [Nitrospiraceae bacterium]|nr:hypothetical protein [Nitrospiraceae bacterium]
MRVRDNGVAAVVRRFAAVAVLALCGLVFADTAALVQGGFPGEDAEVVAVLAEELAAAGYDVEKLDADALCSAEGLAEAGLLVLPNAATLPATSVAPIEAFLKRGGDILALNAPLWQELLINPDGVWTTRDAYERQHAGELPERVLFDFAPEQIDDWVRGKSPDDGAADYETTDEGPRPGQRALHATLTDLRGWDNFGPQSVEAFAPGHTLTVFSAKGGPETRALSVEWREKDGSRWIAAVPLDTEWRRYVLTPEHFKFWESVPARAHTTLQPENAVQVSVGMSFTHTGVTPGPQEWWLGPFGTARMDDAQAEAAFRPDVPKMDTLAPSYKFFDCTGVSALSVCAGQAIVDGIGEALSLPAGRLRAPHPRPSGAGFGKGRDWRWIPLLEATTGDGEWRGNPATLMVHAAGPFKGGQWAAFGIADPQWYRTAAARACMRQIAERMRTGVYLVDGGANFFTYFEDQAMTLGLRAVCVGGEDQGNLSGRVTVLDARRKGPAALRRWDVSLAAGVGQTLSETWRPGDWPNDGYRVVAELLKDGAVIDRVEHEAHVWRPKPRKSFITVENGDLMLDGQRWRAHGVNYMPSSGIATEDNAYFEFWLGARSYDPEIIERDLSHCASLGLNSVSIFLYRRSMEAQNLLDLLRRLDEKGIKANLSLRPGTPIDFEWDGVREMIEYYRLKDNDTVFAYDLAWEPLWMGHDKRVRWDADWEAWIVERYGSVENAERDWGFGVPRTADGGVTNPSAGQLEQDGDWRGMVAAYRRFLDTVLYTYYSRARRLVKSVDPNHLVSFRMTETGNPTMNWHGVLAYDFPYLAAAVDLFEPEGYGRIGDWEQVKPGWFQFEYARWAASELPVVWAEAGVHAWDITTMSSPPARLAYQGGYFDRFYRMLIGSCADGIYWWWYPGGFRTGENSDYGIMNPDGSWRDSSGVIRQRADSFIAGPDARSVDDWITIDRDARADGVAGIYKTVGDRFWQSIAEGHTPGFRTEGTGAHSGNCPLVAVGNTPCNGTNPPKYLDGFFDQFEVRGRDGRWAPVQSGSEVSVDRRRVVGRATITNLGEAAWLPGDEEGGVCVSVAGGPRTPLPKVEPRQSAELPEIVLTDEILTDSIELVVSLEARGRTPFGPQIRLTLKPDGR